MLAETRETLYREDGMQEVGTRTVDQGVSPVRRSELLDAANLLGDARRTKKAIVELPESLRPTSALEASLIQDELALAWGEVGGWKVGAPNAEATPTFAPMPKAWITSSGSVVRGLRYRGLEAEVAFYLGKDLPYRATAYTREEVAAAIASCHPAIEVLESGFEDPSKVDRWSMIGDLQMHGGFVYGPAYPEWESIDFAQEGVMLAVDGVVRVEKTGGNTAGDLLRLLPWLASEGAARTGGLKAGQWITTGSWTGNTPAEKHSAVDVQFSTLGRVEVRFEPEQDLEKGLPGTTRTFA